MNLIKLLMIPVTFVLAVAISSSVLSHGATSTADSPILVQEAAVAYHLQDGDEDQLPLVNLGSSRQLVSVDSPVPDNTETVYLPIVSMSQDAQSCVADPPGDADDLPDAPVLCSGQTVTGAVHRDTDRLDVHKIHIERGQHIELLLDASGDGNVEIFLSPPDSPPISETGQLRTSARSMRPDNQEKIDYIARESGYWYVTVFSAAGQNDYTLTVVIPDEPPAGDFAVRGISCLSFTARTIPDVLVQGCRSPGLEYQIELITPGWTQTWHSPAILSSSRYVLEVSAYLVQGAGDYFVFFEEFEFGDGYYAFGVRPRDGTFALMRIDRVNGTETWTPLIDWTASSHIRRDTLTNRLRVERNGPELIVAVNGQQVGAAVDETYMGNEFGLYANAIQSGSIIRFENMQYVSYQ